MVNAFVLDYLVIRHLLCKNYHSIHDWNSGDVMSFFDTLENNLSDTEIEIYLK